MNTLKCIIIEDEPQAQNTLKLMLKEYCPHVQVLGCFERVKDAYSSISLLQPDFIFLDIQLKGEIGLNILDYFKDEPIDFEIIMTTAYKEYALDAFEISALDYIVKPILPMRLKEAVARVQRKSEVTRQQLEIMKDVMHKKASSKLVLPYNQMKMVVNTPDIIYLKADNVYTEFYLNNGQQILVSKSIKEYENILTEMDFYRTHRSYLINMNQIKSYSRSTGVLMMNNGHEVKVSREKKTDFESRMNLLN